MSHMQLTVLAFFCFVLAGWVINVGQIYVRYQDLKYVHMRGINGARLILAIGAVRRHVVRLGVQTGLLWSAWPRAFFDVPVAREIVLVILLWIGIIITIDTVAELHGRHEVRWHLRDKI